MRALAAVEENSSSVPSTHDDVQSPITPSSRGSAILSNGIVYYIVYSQTETNINRLKKIFLKKSYEATEMAPQ